MLKKIFGFDVSGFSLKEREKRIKKVIQKVNSEDLLFEKRYTQHLIQIGYDDGMKQLPEIRKFLELE